MAPRQSSSQRRSTAPTEQVYDLGVRGRKTGVVLKDTGARDEYGMQPIEDMFSDESPAKENRNGADEMDSESEEEPMDIDEMTAPAPSAFMNSRPPVRARSPPKTNLKSPARRAPGFSSSPLRAATGAGSPSGARGVQRQLDFKKNNGLLANKPTLPRPNGVKGKGKAPAVSNGYESASSEDGHNAEPEEESMAMLNGGDDYGDGEEQTEKPEPEPEVQEEDDEEASPPPPSAKKSKGRPPKKAAPQPEPVEQEDESDAVIESIEEVPEPAEEEPTRAVSKRGRPAAQKAAGDDESQPVKKKSKRTSDADDEQGESSNTATAPKPRGRPPKSAVNTSNGTDAPSKPTKSGLAKKASAKRASTVGDTSVAEVPRGPPLPGARGLFITRRETPGAASTTRSGRASYQPLKFWRNEKAEMEEDDDAFFDGREKIVLPRIKTILRVDDPEPSRKKGRGGKAATKGRGRKKRGGLYDDGDDDDDLEQWEQEGDIITGEVVVWQPEHELDPPGPDEQIEVATDEQIAVSANAITTREIRGASFKFAKTLSMPFFGSGVVDLPPNSEKKPKNSRKMHMSFFVFAGRVQVTVGDTVFSIGRGGMWFVPRGNYYGIENVSNKPARIFFSQGCEINTAANPDASQMAS